MKSRILIVGLSCLALSLVIAIAFTRRPQSRAQSSSVSSAEEAPGSPSTSGTALAPQSAAIIPAKKFSWRDVESEDYHKYIANLRSVGCPEQTIRDIIIADVNKLYAAKETPLKTKPQPTPDNPSGETPEQRLSRLRELRTVQQEKRWVVKELLGIDLPLDMLPSSGNRDYHAFEVALRYLPEEKRDSIQTLQENYWQQSDALKAKYDDKRTPEFVAEYRQLSDSLRQDLGKLLTPAELEDYDIRTSTTAKQLSDKLATYFRPSETEFRQIFRAQREYETAMERLAVDPPKTTQPGQATEPEAAKALAAQRASERQALAQARTAAQSQLTEQLKATLGDQRYTEYERSQDRTYDLLARLGTRYNLPQETVLQAYELQKSFQGGGNAAAADAAARQASQAELQRQLNEQLATILGEQAIRGYRRVHGGSVPIR